MCRWWYFRCFLSLFFVFFSFIGIAVIVYLSRLDDSFQNTDYNNEFSPIWYFNFISIVIPHCVVMFFVFLLLFILILFFQMCVYLEGLFLFVFFFVVVFSFNSLWCSRISLNRIYLHDSCVCVCVEYFA